MQINVGQRLREIRTDRGVVRDELARRLGYHRGYLYQIEAGLRTPSIAMLEKLAEELDTEPSEFLRTPEPASRGQTPDTRRWEWTRRAG